MVNDGDDKKGNKTSIEQTNEKINKMSIEKKMLLLFLIAVFGLLVGIFLSSFYDDIFNLFKKRVSRSVVDIASMNRTLFREWMSAMIKNIENIPLKEKNEIINYVNNSPVEFRIKVLNNNPGMIKYLTNQTSEERNVVLKSERDPTKYYEFFSDLTKTDRISYLERDPYFIRYIKNPTEYEKNIVMKKDLSLIRFIENLTKNERKTALEINGCMIVYLMNPTKEERMLAITQNAIALQFFKYPTEEEKMIALKQNPFTIHFIVNPKPSERLMAVRGDGRCIKFFVTPSKKERSIAIENRPDSYKYIHSLTDDEKEKVKNLFSDYNLNSYFIEHDGSIAFLAVDDRKNNEVTLFDRDPKLKVDDSEFRQIGYRGFIQKYINKEVLKIKYEKIMIGFLIDPNGIERFIDDETDEEKEKFMKSSLYRTQSSFYDPRYIHGEHESALLLQISNKRYVMICATQVYEFEHPYQIVKFFTQGIGFAVAIDEKNNYLSEHEQKYYKFPGVESITVYRWINDEDKYDIHDLNIIENSPYNITSNLF